MFEVVVVDKIILSRLGPTNFRGCSCLGANPKKYAITKNDTGLEEDRDNAGPVEPPLTDSDTHRLISAQMTRSINHTSLWLILSSYAVPLEINTSLFSVLVAAAISWLSISPMLWLVPAFNIACYFLVQYILI